MPLETEIKFRVTDLSALTRRLESAGFRLETPRSFESNTLYDTPDRLMRIRTEILRIRSYAGSPPEFDTVGELEKYFRTVYKPYGWLSDAQWRRLTETSTRRRENGKVSPHYDPKMVLQFTLHPDDYKLWDDWERITAPTLVLRGVDSDLLLPAVAQQMTQRGPRAKLAEIPGCGHAPALNVAEHLELVSGFLALP